MGREYYRLSLVQNFLGGEITTSEQPWNGIHTYIHTHSCYDLVTAMRRLYYTLVGRCLNIPGFYYSHASLDVCCVVTYFEICIITQPFFFFFFFSLF